MAWILPLAAGIAGVMTLAGGVFEPDYVPCLGFGEVVLVADESNGIIFVAADEDIEAVRASA